MDELGLRSDAAALNAGLGSRGLVVLAFGNASVVDRAARVLAIKASGIPCADLTPSDVVLVDLASGRPLDDTRRPSSDTPTHLVLYRAVPEIAAVIHTHSPAAAAWAQARRSLPCLGTSHADHFRGPVPVTRDLTPDELGPDYEIATGAAIVETFTDGGIVPLDMPAVLVACHGSFVWGATPDAALDNATALEHIAAIAIAQAAIGSLESIPDGLRDRHFDRKHGPAAYYGQPDPIPNEAVVR